MRALANVIRTEYAFKSNLTEQYRPVARPAADKAAKAQIEKVNRYLSTKDLPASPADLIRLVI